MTSDLADERFETGTDGGISEVGRRVEEEAQHHTCMFRAVAGWNLKFTTNCVWGGAQQWYENAGGCAGEGFVLHEKQAKITTPSCADCRGCAY